MVGNIGQMLGVANEVRITCHPFSLETLFHDPLLLTNPYAHAQKSIAWLREQLIKMAILCIVDSLRCIL